MSENTEVEEVELTPEVEEKLLSRLEEKMEAKKEAAEEVITKKVNTTTTVKDPIDDMSKEMRLGKHLIALLRNDYDAVRKFNQANIAEMRTKSPFQNEATDADGGYLVPPADFIADVARLENQYGVALRDARVVRVSGNTVLMNKKASGVTMYEMTGGLGAGESQKKTGTKMTFGQDNVTLRKFAAIASVTDELQEDAAVNIYNELTTDFARERARWADRLVFTDASSGIVNTAGVTTITSGTALDQLIQATWQVPTDSSRGGKFYISRSRLGGMLQAKDTQGRYLLTPGTNGAAGTTIWGYPYEVVEVLQEFAPNSVIFGNLQYVTLAVKNGLALKVLDQATVPDADGNDIDLAAQDMTALRAVTRMAARVQFPSAFAVLSNGTVS